MARFVVAPEAMAITCPRCKRPPLSRCMGADGQQVPTHSARKKAAAREAMSHG